MNFKGLIVIIHPFAPWRTFSQLVIPWGLTWRNIDWIENLKQTQSCKVSIDFPLFEYVAGTYSYTTMKKDNKTKFLV